MVRISLKCKSKDFGLKVGTPAEAMHPHLGPVWNDSPRENPSQGNSW